MKEVKLCSLLSDIGPKNQAVWKHLGICSKRDLVVNSVAYPFSEGSQLFFPADVPHLLKNLRNMLLTHDPTLPDSIIRRDCLPCGKVYM
jgi:hypothetical protein